MIARLVWSHPVRAWQLGLAALAVAVGLLACQSESEPPPEEPTQVWTWKSGSNLRNQPGSYGPLGVPSSASFPGARFLAAAWNAPDGRLWLFGGLGRDSTAILETVLNDLWVYDPESRVWAWMSGSLYGGLPGAYGTRGVADPANIPGARWAPATWTDAQGRLWLFGGEGLVAEGEWGVLNDLWRFDPETALWTWVSGGSSLYQLGVYGTKGLPGPDNVPGGREAAMSWMDSQGRLWLFGGSGHDSVDIANFQLNDLWRFDPQTLEWTWVAGSDFGDGLGVYGTKGQADPLNVPGARSQGVSWIDLQGRLWLFGGLGWTASFEDNVVRLNDLWRFDPATLEWTWVHGGSAGGIPGLYGSKGAADPANTPGSRDVAVAWRDPQGMFWLFGGLGTDSSGLESDLNDLWRFDPATLRWTWVSGSDTGYAPSVYGTKGVAAAANVPGSRWSPVSWTGPGGDLWLFGGVGSDAAGDGGMLNDLWRYNR
jgi:N-acetylneuraminic acid mutarotase